MAVFLVEEYELSENTMINGGIRWEGFDRDLESNETGQSESDDSTFSGSVGFSHELTEGWNLSSNLSYAERFLDTAELCSYGAHHATHSFEVVIRHWIINCSRNRTDLRRTIGKVTGQISAFHTKFDDHIFTEATGREHEAGHDGETEHLPEMQYTAVDAEFQGVEAEIDCQWKTPDGPSSCLLMGICFEERIRLRARTFLGLLLPDLVWALRF